MHIVQGFILKQESQLPVLSVPDVIMAICIAMNIFFSAILYLANSLSHYVL